MSALMAAGAGADHRKARAARFSIASNTGLIALKVVAGVLTGSVAIVTEAVHSAIDLVASLIAYFSVRKAEEPARRSSSPCSARRGPWVSRASRAFPWSPLPGDQ